MNPDRQPEPPEERCPHCGAPIEPDQEYCLECGRRLPPPRYVVGPGGREVWTREWRPESPAWLWAALAALLLVALVAGAIVAVAATQDEGDETTAATGVSVTQTFGGILTGEQTVTVPPATITVEPGTVTSATVTTPTVATVTTATTTAGTTTTTTPTTTVGGAIIDWPSGKRGFTVVLESVPEGQGRARADAAAQRALDAGLPQPGVLNSSNYSSLRSGFWVAFSGVYDTLQQAQAALPNARSNGFPLAYVREIAP